VALTVFKTVRDLTLSGWVGSIPMHSRQALPAGPNASNRHYSAHSHMNAVRSAFTILCLAALTSAAQRPDTVRAVPAVARSIVPNDSLVPPLTPRRAFVYSFLLPGYSQSVLGRHKAASGFMFVEAVAVAMIRESAADLHEARRFENDTLVLSYDQSGVPTTKVGRFTTKEVKTRQAHVEDWIALLLANHLFAGADAFVASHLWDVPARLGLRSTPNGTMVTASLMLR
jgi:hypothetical protein